RNQTPAVHAVSGTGVIFSVHAYSPASSPVCITRLPFCCDHLSRAGPPRQETTAPALARSGSVTVPPLGRPSRIAYRLSAFFVKRTSTPSVLFAEGRTHGRVPKIASPFPFSHRPSA